MLLASVGSTNLHVITKIIENAYKLDFPPDLAISSMFNVSDLFDYFPPMVLDDLRANLFEEGGSDAGASSSI